MFLLHFFHRQLPIILITEYPKSGASWLAQLIADCSDFDFPRQRFPRLRPSIFHGHYLRQEIRGKAIVFWRDPRDIMVSWYHHCLFKTDKNNHGLVDSIRRKLNLQELENVRENLPRFIQYSFEESLSPRFSFNDFFDTWHGRKDAIHSSYEALHNNPIAELSNVLEKLDLAIPARDRLEHIVVKNSFASQAARPEGQENKNNYLRKGITGDWKNNFSKNSAEVFHNYAGDRLIKLGYESDDSWIQQIR